MARFHHTTTIRPYEASAATASRFGKITLAGFGVLLVVAILSGYFRSAATARGDENHAADVLRSVNIDRPAPATTSNVSLPATILPWQSTSLNARVTGYLSAWHVDLGDEVEAGELLAEIETPELDQEVAQVEALAQEAAAAAVQAEAERTEAEADLNVAVAQLERVKADVALSISQVNRREKLLKSDSISQEEYDTFSRQRESRDAEMRAAEADVARRRTNLDTRAAIIAARKATATSRLANVDRLKELQSFKRIVAPFDGTVTNRSAEVGMLVTAGTEPLFVLEDMSRVRVQVQVPQSYAARMNVGTVAKITLPESNSPAIDSTVTRIASSIVTKSRTMLAEIELDNSQAHLQPGSYANVILAAAANSSQWTVPSSTLQMRVDGVHVAIVDANGVIEMKQVILGRDLGGRVVISEGIRGDERLIVNPTDDLATGDRVHVNESKLAGS